MRVIGQSAIISFIRAGFIAVLILLPSGCGKRFELHESKEKSKQLLEKFRSIIPESEKPRLVIDKSQDSPRLSFIEGPSWLNGRLYFTNLSQKGGGVNGIFTLEPDGTLRVLKKDVLTVGTTPLPNGNLAVCFFEKMGDLQAGKIVEMSLEGEFLRTIVEEYNGVSLVGPNDLITDRKGGLYFTDPWGGRKGNRQPGTAVYYLNPAGKLTMLTEWNEHRFPNGCVLSPDDTRFFLNDDTQTVWIYDISRDGTLSNKRSFAELIPHKDRRGDTKAKSWSDGMTIDRKGNLYVIAEVGLHVFDKSGELLGIIQLPQLPSHCVFGGEDMSTLYITCRSRIYSIKTNVKGFQYPIE